MEAKQNSLFDFPKMEITKPIRLIELFGGIGSQAMALRDIGANFEHYKLIEFDKHAVASYNAIHGTNHTTHDIRDVHGQDLEITETDKYCYLMTYSFPCTDLSVAGKMTGMSKTEWEEGKATRSGLLWEVERILKELPKDQLPQVLLMENVPQVHAEKNEADFNSWLDFLNSKGYINFYDDLNAKDYGIPQNRERCFCVSYLAEEFTEYNFPEPIKLNSVILDYLEEQVDEKYYIQTAKAQQLIKQLLDRKALDNNTTTADLTIKFPKKIDIANCITARDRSISNIQHIGNAVIEKTKQLAQGGGYGILITEKQICRMTGRNPDNPKSRTAGLPTEQMIETNAQGLCGALTTVQKDNMVLETKITKVQETTAEYRIRNLTPKECWRLMGYTDEDYEKAAAVNSNTQLYKQAGNAIVKQVLMAIFRQMIPENCRQK